MDFESMISKIEGKHLLNVEHGVYPALKKLKKLRNKVHLQECSDIQIMTTTVLMLVFMIV